MFRRKSRPAKPSSEFSIMSGQPGRTAAICGLDARPVRRSARTAPGTIWQSKSRIHAFINVGRAARRNKFAKHSANQSAQSSWHKGEDSMVQRTQVPSVGDQGAIPESQRHTQYGLALGRPVLRALEKRGIYC